MHRLTEPFYLLILGRMLCRIGQNYRIKTRFRVYKHRLTGVAAMAEASYRKQHSCLPVGFVTMGAPFEFSIATNLVISAMLEKRPALPATPPR